MKLVTDGGEQITLGTVAAKPTIAIVDYSRRVTDDFGVTTVVERGFARTMSVNVAVPFDTVDAVQRRMADFRATPATWVADDRFASLSLRGFYKDFELDLATSPLSYCKLTVEALVGPDAAADIGGDPAPEGQASTLQLLQPVMVTDSVLVSSTVAEADAPEWSRTATYPRGSRVIKAATHRIYEALVAIGAGDDPATASGTWLDVGPTNRWSMFDQALGSSTAASSSIEVVLSASALGAIALLDVVGTSVQVRAVGYDRTVAITAGTISFLDLPAGTNRVTVTIIGAGGVSVGTLLAGKLVALGITEASPTAGITDFSRKEIDDFGAVTVVQRAWAKRMSAAALIRTDAIDAVAARIAAVRATPALWIGQAGLDSLTVYGFFKDFSIEVDQTLSRLSLSIEGLSAAAKAAPILDWDQLGNANGTKPANNADVTRDNTAKDTIAVGGRPAASVLTAIDRIEPINVDLTGAKADIAAVKKADIDQAAIQRQASTALARIGEVLTRLTVEQNGVRTTMRGAGIRLDPDTGQVRIYGLDQVADRTSKVEIGLDAVSAQISLRATTDYVNQQIALAQLNPGQAADLAAIIARVTAVEVNLDGVRATVALKADATTVTTLAGTVTSVSQTLDALAGVVRTKADSAVVDALGTRTSLVEQTLQTLGPVTGITMTIRQAQLAADKAGEAVLSNVLGADAAAQRQIKAAAEITQQLYTKILDDGAVEAMARLALAARVGATEAGLVEERLTRADAVSSQAKRIDLVTATFTKADSDEAAARLAGDKANADATTTLTAQVASVSQAVADGDRAQAERTDLLTATVTKNRADLVQADADEAARRLAGDKANADAVTTLGATVASQAQAIVDGDKAQATRTDQLTATVTKNRTDLAQADADEAARRLAGDEANSDALTTLNATVASQAQAIVDGDKAQASRTDQLVASANQARVDGDKVNSDALASLSATVTTMGKAITDGDKANATLITQVGARLDAFGGSGVTIEQKFSALADRTGRIEGQYSLAIDTNRNLVGIQLIGSAAGPGSFNLINTDLNMGTGRIIKNNGKFMQVEGVAFGAQHDLIEWYGPTMPVDQCSRANALQYKGTDGSIYTTASLSAGTLRNSTASSSLAADAVAEVSPFGSNGRPVRYIASWSYRREWTKTYASNSDGRRDFDADARAFAATTQDGGDVFGTITRQQTASTITLTRAFAGRAYEQLQQASYQTQTLTMSGIPPVPGDAAGQATFTSTIGGGFTVLDPQQSAFDRTLRLSLARGFTNTESGVVQRLTIVAIEE